MAYCSKSESRKPDTEPFFFPSKEAFQTEVSRKKNEVLLDLRRRIQEGERPCVIAEESAEHFPTYIRQKRAIDEFAEERLISFKPRPRPKTILLFGETNVGKSHLAHRLLTNKDYFATACTTEYLHGYQNHRYAILDEWLDTWQSMQFMNSIMDRYPVSVKTFLHMSQWQAELIIICTNQRPNDIYQFKPYRETFMRRLDHIHEVTEANREDLYNELSKLF